MTAVPGWELLPHSLMPETTNWRLVYILFLPKGILKSLEEQYRGNQLLFLAYADSLIWDQPVRFEKLNIDGLL